MATAVVNAAYIAASFAVPEPTIQSLLNNPTVELVNLLLQQIEVKAREYDDTKAEKLRLDVELENAVRSGDTRARSLKANLDKGLKDVEDLRRRLNDEGMPFQFYLLGRNVKSSSSTSTSEVQALQSRISTLEASNRDALALVESKSTAHDRLAEELSTQHQKILSLRREVSELEEKNQTLENASMSTKFREQALQQEIDLVKKNNEWYETELQTRSAEYSKYRKEKGARITELQRLNEDANQTVETLRRTETTLRNRLEEISQKAEEGFSRIQQLQEAAAKAEESFRIELDSVQRLADLQKQSADTAKARLQDVQAQLEQVNDNAAEELGQMQAEVETERSQREVAENRVAELELQVEGLEANLSAAQNIPQAPSTPRRGINGTLGTPGRAGSPGIFSPAASRMKGGLTVTQLYSENTQMKMELEAANRRNEKLTATVDDMLQELESKQPELDELRTEQDRLTTEVMEISALLEDATKEKEVARKESRKQQGRVEGLAREGDILRQQLRDLSAQIKLLLVEAQARDQGLNSLDAAQQSYLEQVARGEIDPDSFDDATDTGRLISRRLVLYRNVNELQGQNMELLRTIRTVAEQYEGTEAKQKSEQLEKDRHELERLREKCYQYEDELQSLTTRSKSFIKERDMFRRMLSHRGQLPLGSDVASMFGQSVDGQVSATPPPGSLMQTVEQSPNSKELADYAKLVKDMQSHFDAYRQETATDQASLKQQVDKLARDKSELQGETARISSQLTLAQERYDLLQSNLSMLKTENGELQKRSQFLQEMAAKQDLKVQHVAEELVEAKGLADSMRNENANLKAERELWKKIEARISEDNRSLMDERGRLNKMISDLQNLQNERELSESENRRRLQSRAEFLESELQSVKRKLDDEVEDGKKAALRREYEQEQTRTRIDDLVKSLGNAREELIAAKTQRDQLQARVDEMKIELRNAEERAQALYPRPTPRINGNTDMTASAVNADGLSREQELAIEISDLKRDLELARGEVEMAKAHVEQYKAISQASEEELESLNETNEQYRAEMDQIIAEKDVKIRDLEQRVEDISSELATTNQELSEIRRGYEESVAKFNQQKEILESEVSRLMDESERYRETAKLHQEDLKAQAQIAQQAQQSYEVELMKHGEATKSLRDMRDEYNKLKTEVAEIKAQGEAARTTLAQSEDHWTETRERYERELSEIRTRNDDIKAQNKILHQQLDNVSSQIAGLKQSRVFITGGADTDAVASPSSGVENLQEVIRYLRQEKEIVDVQYELSIQEAKRLKQQLDHTQNQLDQTREKLNAERQSQADKDQSAVSHSKLMQTINELNLFRESNITLRNEARQAQAQLAEKVKEVEGLMNQIQPLQTRVREVENELETKDGELQLLQQDRDRWQKRTQDILQKYDRVDPAELEALKNQLEMLQTERDQALAEKQPLQEQLEAFDERLRLAQEEAANEANKKFEERRQLLIQQFKERSKMLSGQIKDKDSTNQSLAKERDDLQQQLTAVTEELETTKEARDEAIAKAASADTAMHNNIEEGQVDEGAAPGISSKEKEALEARVAAAEEKAIEEANRAVGYHIQLEALNSRVRELENQIVSIPSNISKQPSPTQRQAELHQRIASANAELEQAQADAQQARAQEQAPANQTTDTESSETIEKLKEELAAAQKEADDLRTSAAIVATTTNNIDDGSKSVSDQVTEQVALIRAELEVHHAERVKQAEDQYQARADKMRKSLSSKLTDGKEAIRQTMRQEHEVAMEQLRLEHQTEIQRIISEHAAQIERVRQEAQAALEQTPQQQATASTDGSRKTSDPIETGSPVKAEAKPSAWKPSELEIKDLVATNPVVKNIVSRNIQNKLNAERETIIAKVKEEQEKITAEKLEEAKQIAEKSKASAVDMEGKRQSLKLNMAENRVKLANAKLEVVEQAAGNTPQRPVAEVWEIAKLAKPKPAPPAQPLKPAEASQDAPPSQTIPPVQTPQPMQAALSAQPGQPTPSQPAPTTLPTQQVQSPTGPQTQTQPQGFTLGPPSTPASAFGQPTQQPKTQPSQPSTFGRPSQQPAQQNQLQSGQQQAVMGQGQGIPPSTFAPMGSFPQQMQPFSGPPQPGGVGVGPGIPRPGFGGQIPQNIIQPASPAQQGGFPIQQQSVGGAHSRPGPGQQQFGGTGPAALRGILGQQGGGGQGQTGIPRGGGIPRPGGRGGGNQNQQQGIGQGMGQGISVQGQGQGQGQGGSQLPRGGGGRRGGRGGGQQAQTSNMPQGPGVHTRP
ncbi:hypothetical protein K432DRAFT_404025 [Lepidopterella palustris CBS 459.81]|uniref:Nucleoprotein TPR/MLP1 domain-containing protein n=1 Tax=Lepidopterella palustris CBS 459.81 TaxID=1314670 RepID=A0A8E2EC93_9PEZI|nr:hypothetical protein K432DRAFT_404025 [Lepidopterella palustris CBS 459.81]